MLNLNNFVTVERTAIIIDENKHINRFQELYYIKCNIIIYKKKIIILL